MISLAKKVPIIFLYRAESTVQYIYESRVYRPMTEVAVVEHVKTSSFRRLRLAGLAFKFDKYHKQFVNDLDWSA